MENPFDDEKAIFRVLVNRQGQHSLWPEFLTEPDGWEVVHGPAARSDCFAYVEKTWTDLRPAGLRAEMNGAGADS
ncbi:MbtH family protein [Streptomyces sp. WAC 05977]|nr:MbtH family protein [Streptomyces sp. WAC 05977]